MIQTGSPKVSVLVMTYNHERFIRHALESSLMQVTSFRFEILISEDCSTDRTRDIVKEFQRSYPDRVVLLLSESNLHNNEVVARGIRAAQGEYTALLDGDDYWTSPSKLQKQADFLDNHPECTVCFHQATVHHEEGDTPDWDWTPADQKPFSTLEDIWMGNFIATCATMFRKKCLADLPEWYSSFPVTDWPLHILNARHGSLGYSPENMGVYRYHAGGAYSGFSEQKKQDETLRIYEEFSRNFNGRYDRYIRAGIFQYFLEWAEKYERRGEKESALRCFSRCRLGRPRNRVNGYKRLTKLWLKLRLGQRSYSVSDGGQT